MPYEFIIDFLLPLKVCVKPMFGCFGIYRGELLVLFLRQEVQHAELNGVYVATTPLYHDELLKQLPSTYHQDDIAHQKKNWIFLPEYGEDFQTLVRKACELIREGDVRIGRNS